MTVLDDSWHETQTKQKLTATLRLSWLRSKIMLATATGTDRSQVHPQFHLELSSNEKWECLTKHWSVILLREK